jgi:hypothetical protein
VNRCIDVVHIGERKRVDHLSANFQIFSTGEFPVDLEADRSTPVRTTHRFRPQRNIAGMIQRPARPPKITEIAIKARNVLAAGNMVMNHIMRKKPPGIISRMLKIFRAPNEF